MSRRRRRASLNTRLNDARTPVFVLDHRRQIVFFNAGCEQLTGWTAAEVVGRICDYVTDASPSDDAADPATAADPGDARAAGPRTADPLAILTGSLCPPPEVLAARPQSVPAYLPHRDGRSLGRQIHFFPLTDVDGRVESVLGLITLLDQPRPRTEPTPAQRLHAELASLRLSLRQRFSLASVVCADPSMQRVLVQVNLARTTQVPVVLTGEPGTGREYLARVIHYEGPARSRAFVPLDCRRMAAIDLKLALRRLIGLESAEGGRRSGEDSSGPEKPADTGARGTRSDLPAAQPLPGLRAGTLFLANAEDLPRDVQELLMSAFRGTAAGGSGRSARPGRGGEPGVADLAVRLIVSTSAEPDSLLADETWQSDFYDLVTPLRIAVPPLRRRPGDVPPLAQSLLESHNRSSEFQLGGFTEAVWTKFREYNWPGNIDELSAVVREARAAAVETLRSAGDDHDREPLIGPDHLPFRFRTGLDAQSLAPRAEPRTMPLEPYLEQIEREQIVAALEQARFSKKRAADLLGMTRPRLYRRMEALGIADADGGSETDEDDAGKTDAGSAGG